jgi:hypothetical protein
MAKFPARCVAVVVGVVVAAAAARADDRKAEAKGADQLVGTWKLVSAKFGGKEWKAREGATKIKHVTPAQFLWVDYDKDGQITSSMGGPYTVKGDKYEETPEYGVGPIVRAYKGKLQSFTWKVEGDKWHHTGKLSSGLAIEEVWERVEKK